MALSTEAVGFFEDDQAAICKMEHVPVLRGVTIQAPPALGRMVEGHGVVEVDLPGLQVYLVVLKVAFRAGKYILREGRWSDCNQLLGRLRWYHGWLIPSRSNRGNCSG